MNNPQNPRRELIDHLREKLCDYEEPYTLGAWENFSNKKKRRVIPVFRYSVAAVIAGIGFYLFLTKSDYTEPVYKQLGQDIVIQNHHIPQSKVETTKPTKHTAQDNHEKSKIYLIKEPDIQKKSYLAEDAPILSIDSYGIREKELVNSKGNDTLIKDFGLTITSLAKENKSPIITPQKTIWDADTKTLPAVSDLSKKWGFDILLSSSMIKSGNISAGIQVNYELTNRVILSSGLAVGMLAATEEFNGSPIPTKRLKSTDTKLTGVEIPLEIKYAVSSKLYTTVGISSFAVLDDDRTNNYIEQQTVIESMFVAGQFVTKTSIIEHEFSNKAPRSTFNEANHVGFYSFSVGYKSQISKNNTLSIEPYVKIPATGITDSNLKLGNGGLKIKMGF